MVYHNGVLDTGASMECSIELEVISGIVIALCNVYTIIYILLYNAYRKRVQHLIASFVAFVSLTSILALQVDSVCPMYFTTWGAVSYAFVITIIATESCTYACSHGVERSSDVSQE